MKIGAKFYFTGKPCIHGHIAERQTVKRGCVDCNRIQSLAASRKKRSNPAYVEKERRANAKRAADLRATSPEYVVRKNEANRLYAKHKRETDPEYVAYTKAIQRRLLDDPEYQARQRARLARWNAENPGAKRAADNRRRTLERGANGKFSKEDVLLLQLAQGYACIYCGTSTKEKYHVDHVHPLSRGGSNWPDNLQILCPRCNMQKHDKTHEEFLAAIAANDNYLTHREKAA